MNWLITGGCGFIGSALVRDVLGKTGQSVRVVDNLSVGKAASLQGLPVRQHDHLAGALPSWEHGVVDLVVADIIEAEAMVRAAVGADVVVHLAANTGVAPSVENPRMDCVTNVIGTLNLLEACRLNQVGRFVFASSGAPVGEVVPPIHEEIVPHPVSPYGASKLCGEAYCSAYFRTFGIDTVALRFGNVYGPHSAHKSSVVARFITAILNGQPLTIFGDGSQTRDFIYLNDLLDAVHQAATRPGIGGEVFQIATSQETTVSEMADMLREICLARGVAFPEVQWTTPRLGDVQRNFSDTRKAARLLDWQARESLASGLAKTVQWFLSAQKP